MKFDSASLYHNKVAFYNVTNSDDGYNDEQSEFDFHKWVKIETLSSKEVELSGQLIGEATHKITCRYTSKITATHIIKYKSATYRIIGKPTNVDFANVTTEIIVKEITNA